MLFNKIRCGNIYQIVRVPFLPIIYIIHSLSHLDINYHANVGPGLIILHSSMGIVISGQATIGKNASLVGGNVIGAKSHGGGI